MLWRLSAPLGTSGNPEGLTGPTSSRSCGERMPIKPLSRSLLTGEIELAEAQDLVAEIAGVFEAQGIGLGKRPAVGF